MKRTADRNDEPAALPRKRPFKKKKGQFFLIFKFHLTSNLLLNYAKIRAKFEVVRRCSTKLTLTLYNFNEFYE